MGRDEVARHRGAWRVAAMRLVDVHARLLEMGVPVFQTSDAAASLGIASPHASQLLARLAAGHLVRPGGSGL